MDNSIKITIGVIIILVLVVIKVVYDEKKYMEKLKNPEMILRINGKIHVLPIPEAPKPIEKRGEER